MNKPLVSVIITTKNEEGVLERLLKSIKNQTYGNIETIVVDNASSDKTKQIARKYTEKVFDKGPERSAQRNFGAKKANGKYLLFLDADMELTPKVVEECVELAEKEEKNGAIVIPEESVATNFWENVKAFERSFYNLEGDKLVEAARFFRKKAFEKVGGYDERITGPEDWDLPEKVVKKGYGQGRIEAEILHHEKIPSVFSVAKKKFYYALKTHRYLKKHEIAIYGPKTIYFLRPVFYKNRDRLLENPTKSMAMIVMLTLETLFGAAGFFVGYLKSK